MSGALFHGDVETIRRQSRAATDGEDLSEIELVDQLLRRVPGSFETFYQRYNRLVYHCIRTRSNEADVEDLFQDFFERLVDRDYHILKVWQRGTSLPIYLSTVIRNFVIDAHRKKRWWQKPVAGLSEPGAHEERARSSLWPPFVDEGGDETISTAIVLKELRRVGLQAWAKLDGRDRFLVCGKFHRDLTNEAMAERLSLTGGALRTALSRAQARLLTSLKELAPEYFSA
jgi:RNA polymerase sigma factor (sigma-70 family)